jgi:hypothetical protein
VEGRLVPLQQSARAACQPQRDAGLQARGLVVAGGHVDLGAGRRIHVEVEHLPERAPALVLHHDIAAEPQLEPVQRRLEGEAAAVERGGQRQDRRLELAPQRSVALEAVRERLGAVLLLRADRAHGRERRRRRPGCRPRGHACRARAGTRAALSGGCCG